MRKLQGHIKERLTAYFVNLLYPSKCPLCGAQSDSFRTSPICRGCWSSIERYRGPSCAICSKPVASLYATFCRECIKEPPHFSTALSYGIYTGVLKEAVNLLKFSSLRRLSGHLGKLLCEIDIPRSDMIVPVPLHIRSLRKRGFNQAALISKTLAGTLKIPLSLGLLLKTKETPPQVGLSRAERLTNIKGAFSASRKLSGEKILLVDDVMTTGATVGECSKVLRKAGAGDVTVVTLARTE